MEKSCRGKEPGKFLQGQLGKGHFLLRWTLPHRHVPPGPSGIGISGLSGACAGDVSSETEEPGRSSAISGTLP